VTSILESASAELPSSSVAPVPIRTNTKRSGVDQAFRGVVKLSGFMTFAVLVLIGTFIFIQALPAFRHMGLAFFTTTQWQTKGTHAKFGIEAALFGTIVVAIVAICVAVPVSLCTALFINEYAPLKILGRIPVRRPLISVIDLMAAVPSIIYGLWGLLVLQPFLAPIAEWLSVHMSFLPFLRVSSGTVVFTGSYLIAGVLVAIMVMPIVTSISRELFSLTPIGEREGALAVGATRARVIGSVVLPFAKGGIVGALGEAVAVSVILSVSFGLSLRLDSHGITIASLIANYWDSGGTYGFSGLLAAGFVLFVFTLAVNLVASIIVSRSRRS
jgi:phosphate transport system permease protein